MELGNLTLEGPADLVAHPQHARVLDGVVREAPLLAAGDDPEREQQAEMLRHVLLGVAELVGELLNRPDRRAKALENSDAARLTERAKALGDQLDECIGKRMGSSHGGEPSSSRVRSRILSYNCVVV